MASICGAIEWSAFKRSSFPSDTRKNGESPTLIQRTSSPRTCAATRVAPMPARSGLAAARLPTAALASCSPSASPPPCSRAWTKASTASLLATAPPAWPPMPSATTATNDPSPNGVHAQLSSWYGRAPRCRPPGRRQRPAIFSATLLVPHRRQLAQPPQGEAPSPGRRVLFGQFDVGQALDQGGEDQLGFEPRQLGAQAVVDAATERQGPHVRPADTEPVVVRLLSPVLV